MTSVSNNDIITSYGYDANGNLIEKSLSNGVTTNYIYNKAGLMTYMESKKGGNVYTYSDCTYLLNGLLQRVYMPYDGQNDNETKTKNFNYDRMGRLTGEYIAAAAGVPIINSYEYDLRGNRIGMEGGEPDNLIEKETEYQYDLNNRLLEENTTVIYNNDNQTEASAIRYYYDNNGNMTAKQTTEYANNSTGSSAALSGRSTDTGLSVYRYDAFNRLANYNSGSAEASYRYNANNLRSSKTVNRVKTEYVWNGQNLASETKNGSVNTYTYDITGIHIANQGGTVTSYLKDYHGNIVGRTNAAGAMLQDPSERMDYDAFGNQWNGTAPDPFGYCGEYRDSESGLIYLRNRYYDSSTGRFITEDPVKDGVNWYNYCAGNPVMFIDPWGLVARTKPEYSQDYDDMLSGMGDIVIEQKPFTDENGDEWIDFEVTKIYDTKKHVSQTLILDILQRDEITYILNESYYTFDKDMKVLSLPFVYKENDENGRSVVYFNIEESKIRTQREVGEGADKELLMKYQYTYIGHELFHAYHHYRGTLVNNKSIWVNSAIEENNTVEEFLTVGINYIDENGIRQGKDSYMSIMCENGIRLEFGLPIRERMDNI